MTNLKDIEIRPERNEDAPAIWHVTELAFRGKPYAGGNEQDLIDNLRNAGLLLLSLVAIDDGELVGQISFSQAALDNDNEDSKAWYALGPVSVTPTRQGEGIGAALIEEGLARLTDIGARGCILTGNPNYYQKFGFELSADNVPVNERPEYFMVKVLDGEKPSGRFAFDPTFYQ